MKSNTSLESTFTNCVGASECQYFDMRDDQNSMWPSMATEQDIASDCQNMGDTLSHLAPSRLRAAGGCPNKVLADIAPGTTKNPILVLKNIHLRKQLGIEYLDAARIIY